jgi:hypothetical protein
MRRLHDTEECERNCCTCIRKKSAGSTATLLTSYPTTKRHKQRRSFEASKLKIHTVCAGRGRAPLTSHLATTTSPTRLERHETDWSGTYQIQRLRGIPCCNSGRRPPVGSVIGYWGVHWMLAFLIWMCVELDNWVYRGLE